MILDRGNQSVETRRVSKACIGKLFQLVAILMSSSVSLRWYIDAIVPVATTLTAAPVRKLPMASTQKTCVSVPVQLSKSYPCSSNRIPRLPSNHNTNRVLTFAPFLHDAYLPQVIRSVYVPSSGASGVSSPCVAASVGRRPVRTMSVRRTEAAVTG